jgi:hypothetical protein
MTEKSSNLLLTNLIKKIITHTINILQIMSHLITSFAIINVKNKTANRSKIG